MSNLTSKDKTTYRHKVRDICEGIMPPSALEYIAQKLGVNPKTLKRKVQYGRFTADEFLMVLDICGFDTVIDANLLLGWVKENPGYSVKLKRSEWMLDHVYVKVCTRDETVGNSMLIDLSNFHTSMVPQTLDDLRDDISNLDYKKGDA